MIIGKLRIIRCMSQMLKKTLRKGVCFACAGCSFDYFEHFGS